MHMQVRMIQSRGGSSNVLHPDLSPGKFVICAVELADLELAASPAAAADEAVEIGVDLDLVQDGLEV